MVDGKVHGTDCFEVDSFLQRNGFSKLYQVRHKETGEFFTMEVAPRDVNSRAPVSPYVQQTKSSFSQFWVSLRFTFQTRSKFYYILDFPGRQSLSQRIKSYGGLIPEVIARFYAAEILIALEELHKSCLTYKDLSLDTVYLDSEGHIIIWRSFCGKFYWSKRECVCSLDGFCHGDPCDNNHNLKSDFDFQEDWKSFGGAIYAMLTGESHPRTSNDCSLSAAASDLISRLLRGEVCRSDQIQSHSFFKGVNWHEVRMRRTRPPISNGDKAISFSNQTRFVTSHSSVRPTAENGSSLQRPQSASCESEPSIGPNTGNGPPLQNPLITSRNSDSSFDHMEHGQSLYRPQLLSQHSDPSIAAHLVNEHSTPYRPHSQSHNSDPGDPRYLNSTADHMAPGPSIHHAASTPDLRVSGRDSSAFYNHQPLSVNNLSYHYGNTDYGNARAHDFSPRPEGEMGRRGRLVSRSMSDLSSLGKDTGFISHSPTALQRTFIYPNHETTPPHAKLFHLQSDETQEMYNGVYGLHSAASVPDLSAGFLSFSTPHYTPHSGRAYPTPSQYSEFSSYSSYTSGPSLRNAFMQSRSRLSDSGFSPSGIGYGATENGTSIDLRRYEGSSSRESDYLCSKSENPSSFGRGQSPSPSRLSPSVDYSSPQSKVPTYKSPTPKSSLPGSVSTTRDEADRTPNDGGRERSSTLSRTLSLSNLTKEKKSFLPDEFSEKRRESLPESVGGHRDKYPLAKVPIPTFREFKQKNLERDSKKYLLGGKNETKEAQSSRSPKIIAKHDSKNNTDTRSTLKEMLSSLYESSKDISAQSATKRLSESYKLDSTAKVKTQERKCTAKPTDLPEAKDDGSVTGKETKASRKISKSRQDSPFSKNEVIHQLMLKYGLYEKGSQKKSRNPKNERREIFPESNNSYAKETSGEDISNRTLSPRGKEKAGPENEKNWRNSTDHSNRPSPKESPVSPRNNNQSSATQVKKSAAERFRELKRKNGIRKDVVESFSAVREISRQRNLREDPSSQRTEEAKSNVAKNLARKDPDASMADIIKARTLGYQSNLSGDRTSASQDDNFNADSGSSNARKPTLSLRGTSRAILCATKFSKFRSKDPKSPHGSPLPSKKQLSDIIGKSDNASKGKSKEAETKDANDIKKNDSLDKSSPKTRRHRFRGEKGLRRGGIHTSMLSVASSACSDTEMEDTASIYSEIDSLDEERGTRGRRWESFHSNVSADSGSAHLFEFDTDSNVTEYDEVFDDQDSEDDHSKGEVDVERTDSGVGGDMGHSPLRRSWEEIVMKSSEHWSVVAASARHWQELARRRKTNERDTVAPKKKSSVHSITEDMVECPDCLKYYVPPTEKPSAGEPEICPKCEDRKVERKEAIIELVQTEINYGNDLQILKEEFYLPMQSGGILSPENLAAIFLNLQELLEVNSKFCAKLQRSLEESVAKGDEEFSEVNVGAIFLESVDFFQAYEIYCSKQTAASALLESLQKKTELLRIFLNVTCRENPKCRKMDLNSFILAPVQRIMKYPLLLSRICKATPRRNTDREKLKMAQRKIEEQLNKINALNTAVESRQRRYRASQQLGRSDSLDKLQMKKMASDILNWTMEEMQLLMHGAFQVTIHEFGAAWNRRSSKKALSVCALFCVRGHSEFVRIDSDDEGECEEPLFPGEGEVTDAAIVLLRKKMSGKYTLFKDPLFLDMCIIYRDCELKDAFEVVSVGKEAYVFRASSSREYRRWLKYLRLESKELGAWKRRRNGLPNIMIKNL